MTLEQLIIPGREQIAEESLASLRKLWWRNHRILRDFVTDRRIPFFGTHGAPEANIASILRSKSAYVNLLTFYEQATGKDAAAVQLYAVCSLPVFYARRDTASDGSVLVFDFDRDGKNISIPWQAFGGGYGLGLPLEGDSRNYQKAIEATKHLENAKYPGAWRTDMTFSPETFDALHVGTVRIPFQMIRLDGRRINPPDMIATSTYAHRLLAQHMVRETLRLIDQRTGFASK